LSGGADLFMRKTGVKSLTWSAAKQEREAFGLGGRILGAAGRRKRALPAFLLFPVPLPFLRQLQMRRYFAGANTSSFSEPGVYVVRERPLGVVGGSTFAIVAAGRNRLPLSGSMAMVRALLAVATSDCALK